MATAACGSTVAQRARSQDGGAGLGATSSGGAGTTGAADGGAVGGTGAGAATPRSVVTAAAGPTSRAAASSSAPSAVSLPVSGPGWDKSYVYVGVTTQKDAQSAFQTVGVNGLDPGDQEAEANAVVDELNRRGGVFGRKLKIVFKDQNTVATAQDPNGAGAAACTYFTQDHRVVALLNLVTLMDVQSFRGCMAKGKVPLFSASVAGVDAKVGADFSPYFYQSVAPTWDVLAPALIDELKAQGWFGGWDVTQGAPGVGPAKIGLLGPSDEVSTRVLAIVKNAFAAAGYNDAVVYQYASTNPDFSSAVLNLHGKGVTHVVVINADLLPVQLAAESQHYRPRYGITSLNAPQSLLQANAPRAQINGALGAGWSPSLDVDDANDPGDTSPAEPDCLAMLAKGGQKYVGRRFAEAVSFAYCDGLRLIVQSATAGGGLSGTAMYAGVQTLGPQYASAFGFGVGLGPGRLFIPGAVRPLAWVTSCACFRYASAVNHTL